MSIQQMLFAGSKPEIQLVDYVAQTQTGTFLLWSHPNALYGDLAVAIIWADGGSYPDSNDDGYYSFEVINEHASYTLSTVLRARVYSVITATGGAGYDIGTDTTTSVRQHCHWYVFRNATGVTAGSAITTTTGNPNPPSLTATSGYSKYYWIPTVSTSTTYAASSAPSSYANLIGYSNSLVSSWTAWRTTTSNVEDPGAFGGTMTAGLAATIAVY